MKIKFENGEQKALLIACRGISGVDLGIGNENEKFD
jgi:hypothetical protein